MVDSRSVVVLGGGIVGVTTAYFLSRQGHEVTLIEKNEDAGLETSFARHCYAQHVRSVGVSRDTAVYPQVDGKGGFAVSSEARSLAGPFFMGR